MVDINNPGTWKFLAGKGLAHAGFTPEYNAQKTVELGSNGCYSGAWIANWNAPVWQGNGLSQSQHAIRFFRELKRLGGLIYIQNIPWHWSYVYHCYTWKNGYPENLPQYTDQASCTAASSEHVWGTNATAYQYECIMNVNKQTEYINWVKDFMTIPALDKDGNPDPVETMIEMGIPDILQIMNEVIGDIPAGGFVGTDGKVYPKSYGTPALWDAYIAFCNRYMAEINAIKPNLIYTVSSIPFWDLKEIAKHMHRFVVPNGCKLMYNYHYYYALWNMTPPSWEYGNVAYWNNGQPFTSESQRLNAKNLAWTKWLTDGGIQSILDNNGIVLYDEIGTHYKAPNFVMWMEDAYEFCRQYNLATCWLNNTYENWAGWNHSPASLWAHPEIDGVNDWTLNELGIAWRDIVGSSEPLPPVEPVKLPFRSENLDNFRILKGDWKV